MRILSISSIWAVIFLAPTFVQRLFIGGEAKSYDEFAGLSLPALGYVCHLAIALRYAALPVISGHSVYVIKRWLLIAILSIGHAIQLAIEQPSGAEFGLLAMLRQLLWLFVCMAISGLTTPDKLLELLVKFTHATFFVVAITYVIYKFTGFPFQILLSDGRPRAQGLLSEPSTIGCLIAGYVGLAVWHGRWCRVMLAAVIVLLAYSVIGLIGFVVGLVFALVHSHLSSSGLRKIINLLFLWSVPATYVLIVLFASPISEIANKILEYVYDFGLEDTILYRGFGERLLDPLVHLENIFELVFNGENVSEGGIFRMTSVILMIMEMHQSHHLWVGYGLGVNAQLMLASFGTILDFGLLPFILSSFGLIGGVTIFGMLTWMLARNESEITVYILPFTFIVLFNSAGGIHMYGVVLAFAFLTDHIHSRDAS